MPRRFTPSLLRLAAAGLIGLSAAGCVIGEEFRHGYIIDDAAVAQVRPGASAEQVLQLLGTPTTVSTVGNKSWYYISQNTQRPVMFIGERPKDQRVLAVYFNAGFKVERVALYGEQDGKVFDFISRTTPTSGGEQAFLGQLMRGLTKFEPFGNAR
ncbi:MULTISPECIES: outer membrane protein assembly factor BamE [unclassified Methylobacterium]|uniref:outer membrane protein assembly factor BamE n=1 Tax=unclassified Methylobacterium TaxID=2615210 RepID=UPI0008EA418D|nr:MULTISPECIES: outer membrane protein assembly factor BamE [unclassified Methylobacterium]AWN54384.1 outer membrane protein assembly factor BamE [Methylobacterium sp. 17Sr1-1]MCF4125672.1 outer membrane protein assembly factor BamE [Methylobacterium sp. SyP6R]SFV10196.1 Beta-barrel assembly machine subunit BamE [Methylobacterium sp. 174MFSha1.1]